MIPTDITTSQNKLKKGVDDQKQIVICFC